MGMSCGGIMSYGAAHDPHVTTVGIWNSGLFGDDNKKTYDTIHGSVIIITGGDSDIAHDNGKRDFETMPKTIPAGQLGESPACTIRTTKTGMRTRRASNPHATMRG